VRLNHEFTESRWVTPAEIEALDTSPTTRDTLAELGILGRGEAAGEGRSAERDRAEILAVIEEFRAAFEGGDLEHLATTYCDQLVKLRQHAAPERKAEVLARLAESFQSYDRTLEVVNDEIRIDGDTAVVQGTFAVGLTARTDGRHTRLE